MPREVRSLSVSSAQNPPIPHGVRVAAQISAPQGRGKPFRNQILFEGGYGNHIVRTQERNQREGSTHAGRTITRSAVARKRRPPQRAVRQRRSEGRTLVNHLERDDGKSDHPCVAGEAAVLDADATECFRIGLDRPIDVDLADFSPSKANRRF